MCLDCFCDDRMNNNMSSSTTAWTSSTVNAQVLPYLSRFLFENSKNVHAIVIFFLNKIYKLNKFQPQYEHGFGSTVVSSQPAYIGGGISSSQVVTDSNPGFGSSIISSTPAYIGGGMASSQVVTDSNSGFGGGMSSTTVVDGGFGGGFGGGMNSTTVVTDSNTGYSGGMGSTTYTTSSY